MFNCRPSCPCDVLSQCEGYTSFFKKAYLNGNVTINLVSQLVLILRLLDALIVQLCVIQERKRGQDRTGNKIEGTSALDGHFFKSAKIAHYFP